MKSTRLSENAESRTRAPMSVVTGACLLLGMAGLSGCKSASQCVSPSVEGRVLDAQLKQPIKDVFVSRVNPNAPRTVGTPPKGGQLMEQVSGVRTAANGTFKLDCVKDLAPFRHLSWYSVTVSFEHRDYQPLTATYTVADATNQLAGNPTVTAGDVFLTPAHP